MDPISHIEKLFGADDSGYIPSRHINHLLKLAWSGSLPSEGVRALIWRVLLGLVSSSDKSLWEGELRDVVEKYQAERSTVMPSLDKVKVDPLSAMSSGGANDEWSIYYKNVDLINFIKTDLDRLYISGIPDEHFESAQRRDMLLAILLIWSFRHPVISYRQGMHEMAGYVMYCVELELKAWNSIRAANAEGKPTRDEFGLLNVINEQNVEAHTFHIFARIMDELEPMYDPIALTPRGAENQPFVVQFSTKVQEHYLRMLDPDLCAHLEECHVSAQIYGLRWARLLLGREFTVENDQIYRIWDYLFACCYEAENISAEALLDDDVRPNITSLLATVRIAGHNQHSNQERRNISSMGTVKHVSANESSAPDVPQYVCTPLLGALGDVMLAMMLHIREPLMEEDSSGVLGYLMHYPDMPSVTPVLDYADMIKRGVILGPEKKPGKANNNSGKRPSMQGTAGSASGGGWNLMGMKQRVAEKFNQVTMAMGNGLSEMVSNLADYGEDSDTTSPASQVPLDDSSVRLVIKTDASRTGSAASSAKPSPVVSTAGSASTSAKSGAKDSAKVAAPALEGSKASADQSAEAVVVDPFAPAPEVVAAVEEFDPLSGVLYQHPATAPAAPAAPAAPRSPLLTGKGTGYKNMPADAALPEDRDAQARNAAAAADSILTSPTITGYHIRSKVFNNNWFPSSTAKKDHQRNKRENRSSGGVDLHVLHAYSGNDPESSGNESDHKGKELQAKKSGNASVNKNAVGDRLLDLADALVNPAYASLSTTLTAGRELEHEVEMRRETVRKLRMMADVLAGLQSLESYDAKFAPPVAAAGTGAGVAEGRAMTPVRRMPPTTMSPLPMVREESSAAAPSTAAAVSANAGEVMEAAEDTREGNGQTLPAVNGHEEVIGAEESEVVIAGEGASVERDEPSDETPGEVCA